MRTSIRSPRFGRHFRLALSVVSLPCRSTAICILANVLTMKLTEKTGTVTIVAGLRATNRAACGFPPMALISGGTMTFPFPEGRRLFFSPPAHGNHRFPHRPDRQLPGNQSPASSSSFCSCWSFCWVCSYSRNLLTVWFMSSERSAIVIRWSLYSETKRRFRFSRR